MTQVTLPDIKPATCSQRHTIEGRTDRFRENILIRVLLRAGQSPTATLIVRHLSKSGR